MSALLKQATLAEDRLLIARAAAAARRQGEPSPSEWAQRNAWLLAITPGWETREGQAAITDDEIIAAVKAVREGVSPPAPDLSLIPDADGDHELNQTDTESLTK